MDEPYRTTTPPKFALDLGQVDGPESPAGGLMYESYLSRSSARCHRHVYLDSYCPHGPSAGRSRDSGNPERGSGARRDAEQRRKKTWALPLSWSRARPQSDPPRAKRGNETHGRQPGASSPRFPSAQYGGLVVDRIRDRTGRSVARRLSLGSDPPNEFRNARRIRPR